MLMSLEAVITESVLYLWCTINFYLYFIDKQPMKAGQILKKSLATQRLTQKKNDTHYKQIKQYKQKTFQTVRSY